MSRFEDALDLNLCVLPALHWLYPGSNSVALVLTYQACKLLRLLPSRTGGEQLSAPELLRRAVRMARVLYAPPPPSSPPWPAALQNTEDVLAQVAAMAL